MIHLGIHTDNWRPLSVGFEGACEKIAATGVKHIEFCAIHGQNFIAAPIQRDDSDGGDGRLDHALTSRTTLQGRYSYSRRDLYEPYAGASYAQIPGYGNNVPRSGHNAMAGVTHVFSPSLIAEARFGFSRTGIEVLQQNQNIDLNSQVGLPRWTTNPRDNGLSLVSLLGYSPIGDEYNNPQSGLSNTYQGTGMITWVRGRATYKFGGEFRKLEQNAFRDVQSRGFLQFVGVAVSFNQSPARVKANPRASANKPAHWSRHCSFGETPLVQIDMLGFKRCHTLRQLAIAARARLRMEQTTIFARFSLDPAKRFWRAYQCERQERS
jgi:hypothetical protein